MWRGKLRIRRRSKKAIRTRQTQQRVVRNPGQVHALSRNRRIVIKTNKTRAINLRNCGRQAQQAPPPDKHSKLLLRVGPLRWAPLTCLVQRRIAQQAPPPDKHSKLLLRVGPLRWAALTCLVQRRIVKTRRNSGRRSNGNTISGWRNGKFTMHGAKHSSSNHGAQHSSSNCRSHGVERRRKMHGLFSTMEDAVATKKP